MTVLYAIAAAAVLVPILVVALVPHPGMGTLDGRPAARRSPLADAVRFLALAMLAIGLAGMAYHALGDHPGTSAERLMRFAEDIPGFVASGTLVMLAGMLLAHHA